VLGDALGGHNCANSDMYFQATIESDCRCTGCHNHLRLEVYLEVVHQEVVDQKGSVMDADTKFIC